MHTSRCYIYILCLQDNEIIPADPTIPEAPLAKKSKRSDPQAELERDEEDDVEVQEVWWSIHTKTIVMLWIK